MPAIVMSIASGLDATSTCSELRDKMDLLTLTGPGLSMKMDLAS